MAGLLALTEGIIWLLRKTHHVEHEEKEENDGDNSLQ